MTVCGADGLPPLDSRQCPAAYDSPQAFPAIAPTVSAEEAAGALKTCLEADTPYGARVTFDVEQVSDGWCAPDLAPRLAEAVETASRRHFGQPAIAMGEGASIPFLQMLAARCPRSQFLVIGVLGPGSNAHGPNEFLHLGYAKQLTCCLAEVLAGQEVSRLALSAAGVPQETPVGVALCLQGHCRVVSENR